VCARIEVVLVFLEIPESASMAGEQQNAMAVRTIDNSLDAAAGPFVMNLDDNSNRDG
jgi:hypothetical protein